MLGMYAVYDSKALVFNTPFFCQTDGVARRSFVDLVNDERTSVSRHPEDFSLFQLGYFDDEKGAITALETPACIMNAIDCMRAKENV